MAERGPLKRERFIERDDGIYIQHRDASVQRICSPIRVAACTQDPETKDWGRLVDVQDLDGAWRRLVIDAELLARRTDEPAAQLARAGAILEPGVKAQDHVREFLLVRQPETRALYARRPGWHGERFILPYQPSEARDAIEGPDATVIYDPPPAAREAFQAKGDLRGWRDEVAALCVGNTRLVSAISAGFAAPLLKPLNQESGVLHFVGPSSIGKTTILLVASSVWGGCVRQWRTTDNGLEGTAESHCDLCLCLDEISALDSRRMAQAAYMLANGHGKARATKSGASRKQTTWRVLALSSGEMGLSAKIGEANERFAAGATVRFVDIRADADMNMGVFELLPRSVTPRDFSEQLKHAVGRHRDVAGPVFAEHFLSSENAAMDAADAWFRELVATNSAKAKDAQSLRVLQRFALVGAAGELATKAGVTGWLEGEAALAASRLFRDWIGDRGSLSAETREVLRRIRALLTTEPHRFEVWDKGSAEDARIIGRRAGFVRRRSGGGGHPSRSQHYLLPATWTEEIVQGFDLTSINKTLIALEILQTGKDKRAARAMRPPKEGSSMRLYCLAADVLERIDRLVQD